MTHPTDEELDALAKRAGDAPLDDKDNCFICYEAAIAITSLRTQLAEARSELSYTNKRLEHAFERIERQARTIDDLTVRTNRADAALAAQIEADAGIADDFHRRAIEWAKTVRGLEKHIGETDSSRIATAIRAQPHDRSALDRMLAEAREKTLREAADEMEDERAKQAILALIEKP